MEGVSKKLLDLICCPICKSNLNYSKKANKLRCRKCKKDFEIKEGIPILLPK